MKRLSFGSAFAFGLLWLCIPLQSYTQSDKNSGFNQKVFSSAFSEADKNTWPLKNNQFVFYLIKNKRYLLQGRTAAHWEILLPREAPTPLNFRVETTMTL